MKVLKKILFLFVSLLLIVIVLFNVLPRLIPLEWTTDYSDGFDREIFNSIQIGESQKRVDSLIGQPILVVDNLYNDSLQVSYWYSQHNSSLFITYEKLIITFYNGKVIRKTTIIDSD